MGTRSLAAKVGLKPKTFQLGGAQNDTPLRLSHRVVDHTSLA